MSDLLNSANLKLSRFISDPKVENLLTADEYSVLGAYQRGYASHLQSGWDESTITAFNPYQEFSHEFKQFNNGRLAAMRDMDEFIRKVKDEG
jgi:hypothetical protein